MHDFCVIAGQCIDYTSSCVMGGCNFNQSMCNRRHAVAVERLRFVLINSRFRSVHVTELIERIEKACKPWVVHHVPEPTFRLA